MSQRNFLRKQVIEYKELDRLRKGFRVSAIVDSEPEQGTVKWIGTIKGTMYVGIEFERAVGNQFPETNGHAPFACSVSHSRLVFPEDVKRTGVNSAIAKMEQQRQQQQSMHHLQLPQDAEHFLQEIHSEPYSGLGANKNVNSDAAVGVNKGFGVNHHYHRHNHSSLNNSDGASEDDSEFLSTSSHGNRVTDNCDSMELDEFNERLTMFHKSCSQVRRLIKEYHVRYEELPIHCRFEDCATVNLNLEKLKIFRGEVEEHLGKHLGQCKLRMERVMVHSDLLLPSEERKMNSEIQDLEESFSNLDQEIYSEIAGLEHFSLAYQNLQDFLHERFSRFAVIKTRLMQVERNLVKDEGALCLRIKGIQSILSVLERDHDSSENSEISRLLLEVKLYDYMDISRVLSQTHDLILAEKHLLDEVRTKRALLLEAKESYHRFMERLSKFQSWYATYMKRLSETNVTGPDFDVQHPSLVTEREQKRVEFIEILASARNLRASIFDSSAVDNKIEALQDQWKVLVEKVYRARSRKTV